MSKGQFLDSVENYMVWVDKVNPKDSELTFKSGTKTEYLYRNFNFDELKKTKLYRLVHDEIDR